MSIVSAIETNHYNCLKRKGWDKTYWWVDVHGTIFIPNYDKDVTTSEYYPLAKETLQFLSGLDSICLIMWTCSHPDEYKKYIEIFKKDNINFQYINENPEVTTEDGLGYGCYDQKPYMNVVFEDKAGFTPNENWSEILTYMKYKEKKWEGIEK